ncbi:hypothetical protein [Desulfocastanea catecholica]
MGILARVLRITLKYTAFQLFSFAPFGKNYSYIFFSDLLGKSLEKIGLVTFFFPEQPIDRW